VGVKKFSPELREEKVPEREGSKHRAGGEQGKERGVGTELVGSRGRREE
jgi:hypothetical protein